MREQIDRVKNWKQFLNENVENKEHKVSDWFEEPYNLRYISLRYPFHLVVRNIDCVDNIKQKYNNIIVIKNININNRVKQPITYNILIERWNLNDLKDMVLECYDDLVEYGFISKEQFDVYRVKKAIYDEGYEYFFTTGHISENPYIKNTEQYNLWKIGFNDASKTLA